MTISQSLYGVVTFYSVIIGVVLGVIYDVFRIQRITMERDNIIENIIIFAEDIIFAVISAVIIVLLMYHLNHGRIRWFAPVGAGIGFVIYYNTVGRIVIICSEKIIKFINKFFIRPVVIIIKFVSGIIYNRFIIIRNKLYTKKYISMVLKQAAKGFIWCKNGSDKKPKIKNEFFR